MKGVVSVAAALRSAALFSTMPQAALLRVAARANVVRWKANAEIFRQDAPADAFFFVVDGWVKLVRRRPDGRAALLTTFAKGETFAEAVAIVGGTYPATAVAATDATLARVDAAALRAEIQARPAIGFTMIAAIAQHMQHLVRQIERLKLQGGDERVAEFLLELAHTESGPATFDLPFDKRVIAETLGIAQETLSRAFARLRAVGLEIDGVHVRIRDAAALRASLARQRAEPISDSCPQRT